MPHIPPNQGQSLTEHRDRPEKDRDVAAHLRWQMGQHNGRSALEVEPQALRQHAGAAIAARHFARQAIAAMLRLHDGKGCQHHVCVSQLLEVCCAFAAMVDQHLRAKC
jgi:hypothetical protein